MTSCHFDGWKQVTTNHRQPKTACRMHQMLPNANQSRTQSNACARARMALALGKLTTGTPKFRGSGFVGMHVKPITAQEKFNFPRANAILARAQALLWVRD
jgi:hypothetical protein